MKTSTFDYWNNLRSSSVKKWRENRREKDVLTAKNLKRQSPIRKVSKKQAKKLRVYEKEKKEFFEEVEHCQFPGCEVTNVTLHHAAGRCGDKLTEKKHFVALCWMHHNFCEENPLIAKELGLSLDRL